MEHEHGTDSVTPLANLFGSYSIAPHGKKKRRTTSERAELVRYFFENAKADWKGKRDLSPAYVGVKLAHLSIKDLYTFMSMCEDRRRTGYPWSKFFWGALKHQDWMAN